MYVLNIFSPVIEETFSSGGVKHEGVDTQDECINKCESGCVAVSWLEEVRICYTHKGEKSKSLGMAVCPKPEPKPGAKYIVVRVCGMVVI